MNHSRSASAEQYAWPDYVVRTHNPSKQSENRMHSDAVARSFGFRAALVPGVSVFSHMTQPLVAQWGAAWLARGSAEVSFSKPAYEGDLLTVHSQPADDENTACNCIVTCCNEQGVELASLRAALPDACPLPDARGGLPPAAPVTERPQVSWELLETGRPFPALAWTPTSAENLAWCDDVRDALPLYREGASPFLHPGLVLRQANYILRRRFVLPAWIHVASRITFFDTLRAGLNYEVRAIPEEKWRHKGHEFVRLFVALCNNGRSVAEILHTAIFRPRPRHPQPE
jgi:hypothetical protein